MNQITQIFLEGESPTLNIGYMWAVYPQEKSLPNHGLGKIHVFFYKKPVGIGLKVS